MIYQTWINRPNHRPSSSSIASPLFSCPPDPLAYELIALLLLDNVSRINLSFLQRVACRSVYLRIYFRDTFDGNLVTLRARRFVFYYFNLQ